MGLAVRVLQHGRGRHGVVSGVVAVRVRHARTASVHYAARARAHHQQSHERGVLRQGKCALKRVAETKIIGRVSPDQGFSK